MSNITKKQPVPYEPTHAGTLIRDEIEVRNISQKELAMVLDIKQSFLNEIIKGKRPITAETALLLGKTLEIPAEYFMKFQSQYELDRAAIKEKNIKKVENISLWKIISDLIPVKILIKRGYLGNDLSKNIEAIKEIFSIDSIDGLIKVYSERKIAFYKKSEKLETERKNLITWSVLAEYEARKKTVNTFNFDNLPQLSKELSYIFFENENVLKKLERIFTSYGVRFTVLEKLDKTPIDGYSFWSEKNPAIAITLRHKRIDNLAFTIMHELGHIILHLKGNKDLKFMDLDEKEENEIEKEADNFAKINLIPNEIFIKRMSDESIINLSREYCINPAIIFGRMCYETSNYKIKTDINRAIG
jgi:HTH-type transcriptional regulator/antitoxin HigA